MVQNILNSSGDSRKCDSIIQKTNIAFGSFRHELGFFQVYRKDPRGRDCIKVICIRDFWNFRVYSIWNILENNNHLFCVLLLLLQCTYFIVFFFSVCVCGGGGALFCMKIPASSVNRRYSVNLCTLFFEFCFFFGEGGGECKRILLLP